ncbi:MAG: hypothetical protein LBR75_00425 [Prevotellaceae bacterium]|jgi:hypothetical protein|nr:hypothetical protein [Prevotellaceae bacterium]
MKSQYKSLIIMLFSCLFAYTATAQNSLTTNVVTNNSKKKKEKRELTENDKTYFQAMTYLHGINTDVNYKEAL